MTGDGAKDKNGGDSGGHSNVVVVADAATMAKTGEKKEDELLKSNDRGISRISRFCHQLKDDFSLALMLVWFALFFQVFTLCMVIPIIPAAVPVAADDAFFVGILVVAKSIGCFITVLAFKSLMDRYLLFLFTMGFFFLSLSQLFFVFSDNFYVWFVGRLAVGFSTAFLAPCGHAIIQRWYKDKKQRARVMGYVSSGQSMGGLAGPAIGGALYGLHPVVPFVFVAVLGLVAVPFSIRLGRTMGFDHQGDSNTSENEKHDAEALESGTKQEAPSTKTHKPQGETPSAAQKEATVWNLLCDREASLLLLNSFLFSAFILYLESSIGVFLESEDGPFNFSAVLAGAVYWGGLAEAIGGLISGHLTEKIGTWYVIVLGLAIQGVFIALGPKDILAISVISISLQGLGFALGGSMVGQAQSLVSDERFGGSAAIFSVDSAVGQLGVTIGPLLGGYLTDAISFELSSLILGGIEVAIAIAITLLIVSGFIPRR